MAKLVLNDAEISELLTGRNGPVYRATKAMADAIVEEVRANGPLGFDQGGHRAVGLLREDMRIRDEEFGPAGIKIVVGTDPMNPNDGYHYALVIHQGRDGFTSKKGPMTFLTRDNGLYEDVWSVGPAEAQPFLYEAVDAVNGVVPGVEFILIETPSL